MARFLTAALSFFANVTGTFRPEPEKPDPLCDTISSHFVLLSFMYGRANISCSDQDDGLCDLKRQYVGAIEGAVDAAVDFIQAAECPFFDGSAGDLDQHSR